MNSEQRSSDLGVQWGHPLTVSGAASCATPQRPVKVRCATPVTCDATGQRVAASRVVWLACGHAVCGAALDKAYKIATYSAHTLCCPACSASDSAVHAGMQHVSQELPELEPAALGFGLRRDAALSADIAPQLDLLLTAHAHILCAALACVHSPAALQTCSEALRHVSDMLPAEAGKLAAQHAHLMQRAARVGNSGGDMPFDMTMGMLLHPALTHLSSARLCTAMLWMLGRGGLEAAMLARRIVEWTEVVPGVQHLHPALASDMLRVLLDTTDAHRLTPPSARAQYRTATACYLWCTRVARGRPTHSLNVALLRYVMDTADAHPDAEEHQRRVEDWSAHAQGYIVQGESAASAGVDESAAGASVA